MSKAIEDVAAERKRQIDVEGWSSDHDDAHDKGEMAGAAACYALAGVTYTAPDHYPTRKKYAAVVDVRNSIPEKERATTREAVKLSLGEPAAPKEWPFDASWWKPTDRRRNLVKAGGFIIAEIERLDRVSPPTPVDDPAFPPEPEEACREASDNVIAALNGGLSKLVAESGMMGLNDTIRAATCRIRDLTSSYLAACAENDRLRTLSDDRDDSTPALSDTRMKGKTMADSKKHTPGPWEAVKAAHGPIDILDKRGRDVVTLYGGGVETESLAPNATLIAAAPEMLEALDLVVGCLLWSKQDEASQEVMRRVNAVRAKAEGRS